MANKEQLEILLKGADAWNSWRRQNSRVTPDLSRANLINVDLSRANLDGVDLSEADLSKAQLSHASLHKANLESATLILADLLGAIMNEANLASASFFGALLFGTRLKSANLSGANLLGATLMGADLSGANLSGAHLMGANFHEANLDRAVLERANLTAASLVGTRVQDAIFTGSLVHGISAWNLEGEPASQGHMIVTPLGDPPVIVGDLELALFVNLILYGKRLAAAIQKRCPRMVLCVGRHRSSEDSELETFANDLQDRGYLPVLVNSRKPDWRVVFPSVLRLASFSQDVIVDLTGVSSGVALIQELKNELADISVHLLLESTDRELSVLSKTFPDLITYDRSEGLTESVGVELFPQVESNSSE